MPMRKFLYVTTLLATLPLTSCGEKPQTLAQTEERAENCDQTPVKVAQRQRALNQGEANRNDTEGMLR